MLWSCCRYGSDRQGNELPNINGMNICALFGTLLAVLSSRHSSISFSPTATFGHMGPRSFQVGLLDGIAVFLSIVCALGFIPGALIPASAARYLEAFEPDEHRAVQPQAA